jgi:hypothetical protein
MFPAFRNLGRDHKLLRMSSQSSGRKVLVHGYRSLRIMGILCNWNRRVLTIAA